jgi:hypothetical protein
MIAAAGRFKRARSSHRSTRQECVIVFPNQSTKARRAAAVDGVTESGVISGVLACRLLGRKAYLLPLCCFFGVELPL